MEVSVGMDGSLVNSETDVLKKDTDRNFLNTVHNPPISSQEFTSFQPANLYSSAENKQHSSPISSQENKFLCDENDDVGRERLVEDVEMKSTAEVPWCSTPFAQNNSRKRPACLEGTQHPGGDDTLESSQKLLQVTEEADSLPYIDSRFIPGFVPKRRKRRYFGPCGGLEDHEWDLVSFDSDKTPRYAEIEIENKFATCSQISAADLLLPSWQKLQADVSSHSSLLWNAKHYSIHRVLQECRRNKPPMHVTVPVLCVLIKTISSKERHHWSRSSDVIFKDDTDEMPGIIDDETLRTYKEDLIDGASLILTELQVLFVHIIVQKSHIAAIYTKDGNVRLIHSLDVAPVEEPMRPLAGKCPQVSSLAECATVEGESSESEEKRSPIEAVHEVLTMPEL